MPFITFEGPDGSGKTTHIRLAAEKLAAAGYPLLVSREPGGTALGDEIRSLLMVREDPISPTAEMLLLAAARAQHVNERIQPYLAQGGLVLCDRYIDSSIVYQGYALGLGMDRVQAINEVATGGLWPDLTILLLLSSEEAYARSQWEHQPADRFENRGLEYYRLVCSGYEAIASRFPERVRVVRADRPKPEVHREIMQLIDGFLEDSARKGVTGDEINRCGCTG